MSIIVSLLFTSLHTIHRLESHASLDHTRKRLYSKKATFEFVFDYMIYFSSRDRDECLVHLSVSIFLRSVDEQVANTTGVTPLVVVPGDELDEFLVQLDTGGGIEDGGSVVSDKVSGNNAILSVLEDSLERTVCSLLDGGLDLVIGSFLLETDDQVDDRDIGSGDTERQSTVMIVNVISKS